MIMVPKLRWRIITLLIGGILVVSCVVYKYPIKLQSIISREIGGDNVKELLVKEYVYGPWFDYDYVITDPQEIEGLIDYLNDITLSRRIFAPPDSHSPNPNSYHITIVTHDGYTLSIILKDYYLQDVRFNKVYNVLKPKNYQELHEIIAGSPGWWQQ